MDIAVQPAIYTGESDPVEILNFVANRTGHAILAGDFDTFFAHVLLPHTIDTFHARKCITSKAEFREVFYSVHHHYRRLAVTSLLRMDVTADFGESRDEVVASFETRFMSGQTQARDPAPGLVILRQDGLVWKTVRQSHATPWNCPLGGENGVTGNPST